MLGVFILSFVALRVNLIVGFTIVLYADSGRKGPFFSDAVIADGGCLTLTLVFLLPCSDGCAAKAVFFNTCTRKMFDFRPLRVTSLVFDV